MPGWLGAVAISLALDVPDVPKGLASARLARPLAYGTAALVSTVGALACLEPFEVDGGPLIVPHSMLWLPRLSFLIMLALATGMRAARARLGSTPEALAASGTALYGTGIALALLAASDTLEAAGVLETGALARRGLAGAGLAALVAGHAAMLGDRRPIGAARALRRVLAAVLALTAAGAVVARTGGTPATDPVALGVLSAALALGAALLYSALVRIVDRALAPDGGRLLAALEESERRLWSARTDGEVGEAVLVPIQRAARSPEARALLWLVDPDREVKVDAAGGAHASPRPISPAVLARLTERPGEVLLRGPLDALVVRRPDLRPLATVLEQEDALAVVALVADREIEGALVVPRGRRKSGVTLEEIAALERLATRLGPQAALLSAETRAQARAGESQLLRSRLEDRIEALEDELGALREDARTLKAGKAFERLEAPLVAYGPAMKAMVKKAEELAPLEAPVLVRAERGTPLEPIARLLHDKSTRAGGPLVVAECLSIRPGREYAALFGEDEGGEPHPGWLRLAQGGSALLCDLPSLPLEVQRALADALATKSGRADGSTSAFAIDTRVIATSGVDLATLVEAGVFDADLAERIGALTLEVPTLAQRHEDLGSLVLLSIDRACRALGRPTLGIEDEAMAALSSFAFTGGVRELDDIVERAAERASGPRITTADLALDAPVEAAKEDAWSGTWAELESRMLEKALERAGGNKSEAARLLGLKRTTFLDKLKRAGLERASQFPPAP